jgi:hypothetical protein
MSTSQLLNYITLKEACPVVDDSNGSSPSSSSQNNEFNLRFPNLDYNEPQESLQQTYFNKVEEANDLIPQIKLYEEKYFTDKYGSDIYNYLKSKRETYIQNKTSSQSCSDSESSISNIGLVRNIKEDISNELYTYNKLHENEANTKINNFKYSIKSLEDIIKNMNNKSNLSNRKLIYRNEVISSYMNWNIIITYAYYFILCIVFAILFISNNLNLGNWYIYLFVIIFPYLYTYVFKIIVFLSVKINEKINYNGPKSAFVKDLNSYDSIIDKFNI